MRMTMKLKIQETVGRLQPEAAHFGPESGVHIVFNLKDPSQLSMKGEGHHRNVRGDIP